MSSLNLRNKVELGIRQFENEQIRKFENEQMGRVLQHVILAPITLWSVLSPNQSPHASVVTLPSTDHISRSVTTPTKGK
jgi:hypothetical protein